MTKKPSPRPPNVQPVRLGFVGWGAIARSVAQLLQDTPVEIVAVAVRDSEAARPDLPSSAKLISDPAQLRSCKPDVVAEAAGGTSVGPWGHAALEAGADFIVSSVGALADAQLLDSLRAAAVRHQAQVQIQTGALAGIDALGGARLMGLDHVEHRMTKPPRAWLNTPAEALCALDDLTEPTVFFQADAAETALQFPKNANVAMTTALAGLGPQATTITLVADPDATTNQHQISAHGAFGRLDVSIHNNPLPDNPKTSAMAALNLARAIQNRTSPIVI